jgi:hypothetical protein
MNKYRISYIKNSRYKRWKHLLRLIHNYLVIFKKCIIQKLGIKEYSTLFSEQEVLQNELPLRIKNMLGRYQKMNIKKIDDKTLCDQNRNILIIPPYYLSGSSKFNYVYSDFFLFFEDPKALKKLEDDLFKVLVDIIDILSNDNNRNDKLLGETLKSRPSFSICIKYIPYEINAKVDHLPEPVLYELTVYLIGRLHEYIAQNENLHNYQYFVEEIRDEWLLKSGVYLDV